MTKDDVKELATELLLNRIENGYPYRDDETALSVALEMHEQSGSFPDTEEAVMARGVHEAMTELGIHLPLGLDEEA